MSHHWARRSESQGKKAPSPSYSIATIAGHPAPLMPTSPREFCSRYSHKNSRVLRRVSSCYAELCAELCCCHGLHPKEEFELSGRFSLHRPHSMPDVTRSPASFQILLGPAAGQEENFQLRTDQLWTGKIAEKQTFPHENYVPFAPVTRLTKFLSVVRGQNLKLQTVQSWIEDVAEKKPVVVHQADMLPARGCAVADFVPTSPPAASRSLAGERVNLNVKQTEYFNDTLSESSFESLILNPIKEDLGNRKVATEDVQAPPADTSTTDVTSEEQDTVTPGPSLSDELSSMESTLSSTEPSSTDTDSLPGEKHFTSNLSTSSALSESTVTQTLTSDVEEETTTVPSDVTDPYGSSITERSTGQVSQDENEEQDAETHTVTPCLETGVSSDNPRIQPSAISITVIPCWERSQRGDHLHSKGSQTCSSEPVSRTQSHLRVIQESLSRTVESDGACQLKGGVSKRSVTFVLPEDMSGCQKRGTEGKIGQRWTGEAEPNNVRRTTCANRQVNACKDKVVRQHIINLPSTALRAYQARTQRNPSWKNLAGDAQLSVSACRVTSNRRFALGSLSTSKTSIGVDKRVSGRVAGLRLEQRGRLENYGHRAARVGHDTAGSDRHTRETGVTKAKSFESGWNTSQKLLVASPWRVGRRHVPVPGMSNLKFHVSSSSNSSLAGCAGCSRSADGGIRRRCSFPPRKNGTSKEGTGQKYGMKSHGGCGEHVSYQCKVNSKYQSNEESSSRSRKNTSLSRNLNLGRCGSCQKWPSWNEVRAENRNINSKPNAVHTDVSTDYNRRLLKLQNLQKRKCPRQASARRADEPDARPSVRPRKQRIGTRHFKVPGNGVTKPWWPNLSSGRYGRKSKLCGESACCHKQDDCGKKPRSRLLRSKKKPCQNREGKEEGPKSIRVKYGGSFRSSSQTSGLQKMTVAGRRSNLMTNSALHKSISFPLESLRGSKEKLKSYSARCKGEGSKGRNKVKDKARCSSHTSDRLEAMRMCQPEKTMGHRKTKKTTSKRSLPGSETKLGQGQTALSYTSKFHLKCRSQSPGKVKHRPKAFRMGALSTRVELSHGKCKNNITKKHTVKRGLEEHRKSVRNSCSAKPAKSAVVRRVKLGSNSAHTVRPVRRAKGVQTDTIKDKPIKWRLFDLDLDETSQIIDGVFPFLSQEKSQGLYAFTDPNSGQPILYGAKETSLSMNESRDSPSSLCEESGPDSFTFSIGRGSEIQDKTGFKLPLSSDSCPPSCTTEMTDGSCSSM